MKRLLIMMAILVSVFVLAGCAKKTEEVKFDGEEGTVTFTVKKDGNYKISTDKKDLRTSREQGVLIADNFKIGIEFVDDYEYFFNSDFNKLKEARKDYDDFKEVTYNGHKAVQYFYGGYNCYNILIPIEENKKYYLELSVYGKEDKESSAKEAIKLSDVQDILNKIKFTVKEK